MLRPTAMFLGLTLCVGLTGCDSGGIQEGTPKDVSGVVQPSNFEDMMKRTGGAMGKPGAAIKKETTKPKDAASTKETPKEPAAEAEKPAPPK